MAHISQAWRAFFVSSIVVSTSLSVTAEEMDRGFEAQNDVTWNVPGEDENDSMPIGNGDIAANVWTEPNGDLVLLVAKSDAWTETGKLVKLGRLRIRMNHSPFAHPDAFTQTLKLEHGSIEIQSGANALRVWIDANRPVLHVDGHLALPVSWEADVELWRTNTESALMPSPQRGGLFEFGGHSLPIDFEPDTVLPSEANSIVWCHYNLASIYPTVFRQEHLESLLAKYPDPLFHRCFGAMLTGPGLIAGDGQILKSSAPSQDIHLSLYALTEENVSSPEQWRAHLDSLAAKIGKANLLKAWEEHRQWWNDFWDRSWIHVSGAPDASDVSQGYAMQRYMMASSSRGKYPVKFNGGLFTVGHDMSEYEDSTPENHNPDFRAWGNSYWNQNNRLLYWPLIATGDEDLLQPWFQMYFDALPLAEDRTRIYYHHDGAAFVETMYFWGLPNLNDFGWDNPSNQLVSEWMRYHIQGTLEVVAQMLDSYDNTQNSDFARDELVPFANSIVTYYDQHWPRGPDGEIRMFPTQSLETYQRDALNPTPDIAGLDAILPRLLALSHRFASPEQRELWSRILRDLPPIPMGKTFQGKLPRSGPVDPDGTAIILPAEKYGKTRNGENPQLYVAFPYRLYGVGKPGLALARNTFAARLFPQDTCWGQDGTQASILGLTDEAKKVAIAEFTDFGDERFKWFWNGGHDWIPDLDNGGSGMITLQNMLMQCDGKRIILLPAWPADWTADFKLHAPYQTTVEGHVENGHVLNLKVTPASRKRDVIIFPTGQHPT
jgi:alpha-L-fucosidase 2